MSRGRTVASEPGVEDLETGSVVTLERGGLICQQVAIAVPEGCLNSRVGFSAGANKASERASVPPPFELLLHASASVLVWLGPVVELSVALSLEGDEAVVEVSVSVDS